ISLREPLLREGLVSGPYDLGRQRIERRAQHTDERRVAEYPGNVEVSAGDRHRERRVREHARSHRLERLRKRGLRVRRAVRRVQQRDRLVQDLHAAHEPVERVLEDAGDSVRILRTADEETVRLTDSRAQRAYRWQRLVAIEGRIEMGEISEAGKDRDLDVDWCDLHGGSKERAVGRGRGQAAGDGENTDHSIVSLVLVASIKDKGVEKRSNRIEPIKSDLLLFGSRLTRLGDVDRRFLKNSSAHGAGSLHPRGAISEIR